MASPPNSTTAQSGESPAPKLRESGPQWRSSGRHSPHPSTRSTIARGPPTRTAIRNNNKDNPATLLTRPNVAKLPLPRAGIAPTGGIETTGGAANCASDDSGRQSVMPSGCTSVFPLTRPSSSHCRKISALTGPYNFPSLPMILYMPRALPNVAQYSKNHNRRNQEPYKHRLRQLDGQDFARKFADQLTHDNPPRHRRHENHERIEPPRRRDIPMQQLVRRPQPAAAWAIPARHLMKKRISDKTHIVPG